MIYMYIFVHFLENFLLIFLHKCTVDEIMCLIVEIGVHFVGSSLIFHIPLSFCDAIIWCCNSIRSNSSSGADKEESCSGVKSLTLQMPCPIRVAFILWSLMYLRWKMWAWTIDSVIKRGWNQMIFWSMVSWSHLPPNGDKSTKANSSWTWLFGLHLVGMILRKGLCCTWTIPRVPIASTKHLTRTFLVMKLAGISDELAIMCVNPEFLTATRNPTRPMPYNTFFGTLVYQLSSYGCMCRDKTLPLSI